MLYTTFRGTSFQLALRPAIVYTCLAGLWCWVILLLEALSENDPQLLSSFLEHCNALSTLIDSLKTYVSFMFVFYAVNSLTLWARVFWISNEIDDRAIVVAMLAACVVLQNCIATNRPSAATQHSCARVVCATCGADCDDDWACLVGVAQRKGEGGEDRVRW